MNLTHGMYGTAENRSWNAMVNRCTNPNNQAYKRYGGRGIKVCPQWRAFEVFLIDMGEKPTPEHSIERIDNEGDYEPSNCKWATRAEQNNNQRPQILGGRQLRPNNTTGVNGVRYTKKEKWLASIRVDKKAIHLGTHRTLLDAVCARKSAEVYYDKLRGRLD